MTNTTSIAPDGTGVPANPEGHPYTIDSTTGEHIVTGPRVIAVWHGGSSYSHGYIGDDAESFASIREAVVTFGLRLSQGRSTFRYVSRDVETTEIPAVDDMSTMWLYRVNGWQDVADLLDSTDPYPDVVLSVGPRGGIVRDVA